MKNVEYFMALPYQIKIQPIPEDKCGGYEASIPDSGEYAVCAEGETAEEALWNLQSIKEERLAAYLEEGLPIPEPETADENYTGKFVLRIPKSLHQELSQRANRHNGETEVCQPVIAWIRLGQWFSRALSHGISPAAL